MKDYVMTVLFSLAFAVGAAVGCGAEPFEPIETTTSQLVPGCQAPSYSVPNVVHRCTNWPLQATCYYSNPGVSWYQIVGCRTPYCNGVCSYVTCVPSCP